MMKRARKVSNVRGEVHFKQKQIVSSKQNHCLYWKYTPPQKAAL